MISEKQHVEQLTITNFYNNQMLMFWECFSLQSSEAEEGIICAAVLVDTRS